MHLSKRPFRLLLSARRVLLSTLVLLFLFGFSQTGEEKKSAKKRTNSVFPSGEPAPLPFDLINRTWTDSVFNSLTEEERIAQLFMVAAYSNKKQDHVDKIKELVRDYKIGGLIFFQGGPHRQAVLTNEYQALAKVPLLLSMDAEWGLAMRLDSTVKYPRQMTLGAIQDDQKIYDMGADIAAQCKRLGVHVNLAPVADVNVNPNNPVINSRSFGEDRDNVTRKAVAYMRGMQDNKVLANAKHFPGHGDTDTDSHLSLPVIKHSRKRLDSIELYPFKAMIREGLGSMMIAHLYIPELDSTKNQASTLSRPIVNGLLKDEMGFRGLIFTDALNMKGVSAYYKPGEVDLKALLAGNDVLLFSEDVPTAITKIKQAIVDGSISQDEIDRRCRKILSAKEWVGLNEYKPVELENLYEDLNAPIYERTNRDLVESAITLVRNYENFIPLRNPHQMKIASVAIGEEEENTFQKTLSLYGPVTHFQVAKTTTRAQQIALLKKLEGYDLVLVGLHQTSNSPRRKFGITKESIQLIRLMHGSHKVAVSVFANPYSLKEVEKAGAVEGIIVGFQDDEYTQSYVAQMIFGGVTAKGKLPVTGSAKFPMGTGILTQEAIRLKYTIPEEVGLNSADMERIDEIAMSGIKAHAYPGCQVFVAKEGKVIYNKSFGHHTYEEKLPVQNSDLYDLASITKIAASLAAIMKLHHEGRINIDRDLCDYLPELVDTTDYQGMNLRAMLAHQAGLAAWIPFYLNTLVKGQPRYDFYSLAQSDIYPYRVAENLYMQKDYHEKIMEQILATEIKNPGHYRYSDVGYYFFQRIIEKVTGQTLDEYVAENFYTPLGMTTTTYKPREKFPLEQIVPTEYDMAFRKQLVHGDVHDPGAAMLGGVGGHAGLFSNANDLAKLMQMYMAGGTYGGRQYLMKETINEFAQCQFCDSDNRRGAGFDKPVRDGSGGPTCDCVSLESFGHSGFTGTLAWADPEEEVVYVFLSNRIHPSAKNSKLVKMGIRTDIMEAIYKAIENSKATSLK